MYVGILTMQFLFIPTHSEPTLNEYVLLLPKNVLTSRSLLCMERVWIHPSAVGSSLPSMCAYSLSETQEAHFGNMS